MQHLVLGMHRSGTSALTRVLGLMGCHLGAEHELTPGDAENPKGYFERRDAWALDEWLLERLGGSWHDVTRLDGEAVPAELQAEFVARLQPILARLEPHRPWAVKDPRMCLLLPSWRAGLSAPVGVLLHRDPLEVALSLKKRDGFPLAAGLGLWERHTRDALRFTSGMPRALVRYADLLADPPATAARLLRDLERQGAAAGLHLPDEGALRDFLDPALRRQRAEAGEVAALLAPEQRALLERLQGPQPLGPAPLPPLSRAGREALESLATARRREQDAIALLEGMIREKDRYVVSLQERGKADGERLARLQAELAVTGELGWPAAEAPAARPPTGDFSGWAAGTIVSRNYLSLARTCCRTFLEQHPGARAFVLVVDRLEGFDPAGEPFECLAAEQLGIPRFEEFAFKYSVVELNTAVKPWFLERLLQRPDVRTLVYLDPDIQVFGPFEELRQALDRSEVVLTPHTLEPPPQDGRRPTEQDFLVSGAYNLGFVALRRGATARRLLRWWQERLYDGAYSDPQRGLFTDQKWMDLVPSYFPRVGLLRHPGYNVAYWNLHERQALERGADGRLRVEGAPLRFFHFSGYDRRRPEQLSKHQDRWRVPGLGGEYQALFAGYAAALDQAGWEETARLPYAYGSFDNGARVPEQARRLYRDLGPERSRFGNPFEAGHPDSFFEWLTRPGDEGPSPLERALHGCRADLVAAFPDPGGHDRRAWLGWLAQHLASDFGLGEPYTTLVRAALAQAREALAPAEGPSAVAPQVEEGPAQTRLKRVLAGLVGEERYRSLRRELVWPLYARLRGPAAATAAPATIEVVDGPRPFGVNLLGYLDTESGVGEVARGLADLLRESGLPHALVNVEQSWLRRGDRRLSGFSSERPYAVDVVVVNADQLPAVGARHGLRASRHGHRVGYWFWELSHFPEKLHGAYEHVDEVWVASEFCRQALAAPDRRPVHKVVPALQARPAGRKQRAAFGLGPEFTFLFIYDAASVVERKNPGAAVTAFRRAFRPEEPVRLVLKTTSMPPRQLAALQRLAGPARLDVRNGYLHHGELLDLVAACDAYVSLHRSEGLGLTLLDALMLGKPVVATPYSGVTEFFAGPGTYPVAFRERPLVRDFGPYPRGAVWAEPEVEDAARQLRAAYEQWRDPTRRPPHVGEKQRRQYGPGATLPALVERLDAIRRQLSEKPGA